MQEDLAQESVYFPVGIIVDFGGDKNRLIIMLK